MELERYLELSNNQLDEVDPSRKLSVNDMGRLLRYTKSSLFNDDECCLWNGYIANKKGINKKVKYAYFYFKKQKVALHRILFENYKDTLSNDEYIKFDCKNKGKCCNINHMNKFKYELKKPKKVIEKKVKKDLILEDNLKIIIYVNSA